MTFLQKALMTAGAQRTPGRVMKKTSALSVAESGLLQEGLL